MTPVLLVLGAVVVLLVLVDPADRRRNTPTTLRRRQIDALIERDVIDRAFPGDDDQ